MAPPGDEIFNSNFANSITRPVKSGMLNSNLSACCTMNLKDRNSVSEPTQNTFLLPFYV